MIGFASSKSFHRRDKNDYMEGIFLIIICGIYFCEEDKVFKVAYRRCRGKGCIQSIFGSITMYLNNAKAFIQQTFSSECITVQADSLLSPMWINSQVQGSWHGQNIPVPLREMAIASTSQVVNLILGVTWIPSQNHRPIHPIQCQVVCHYLELIFKSTQVTSTSLFG